MDQTQVFISYKFHDENDNILPDYFMAKDVYERLLGLGLEVFFSDETLRRKAQSYYKKMIDEKLDEADILIVVSTSPEHCNSNWVRYEWDTFYQDILSDRKKGQLISYLDTNDISGFPRTIRNLQVFEANNKNGLSNLVDFVCSYFKIKVPKAAGNDTAKGSSYNYDAIYELGDEKKRLSIQGNVEGKKDYKYISRLLPKRDKVYNILDVGCSVGKVTFDVFSNFGDSVRIIGVDKFPHCVEGFNANAPHNMHAELLNFEDLDWEVQLKEIMEKNSVYSFDLVYCSLSLHHMSNSFSVVKKLWKYISENGHIYLRTCDDALKIAYPQQELISKIINKTASVPRVSDRFHGRKAYSMLYKARFKNIEIKSFLIDTGYKDIDERYALFYSTFVWRKNYFKNQLDRAETPEEIEQAMADYNEVLDMLEQIEDLFSDTSFYFGYYVTIAIGTKSFLAGEEAETT